MKQTKAKAKRFMQRPTKAELLQRCGDKHWNILTKNSLMSEGEVNKCIDRLDVAVAKLTNGVATAADVGELLGCHELINARIAQGDYLEAETRVRMSMLAASIINNRFEASGVWLALPGEAETLLTMTEIYRAVLATSSFGELRTATDGLTTETVLV